MSISGTLILLNETGDLTLSWKDDDSDKMRTLIERKMKQGYSFFILEPSFLGLFKKQRKITDINSIQKDTDGKYSIMLCDKEAEKLFSEGTIRIGKTPEGDFNTTHRSTNVNEICQSSSVAVQPMRAG